MIMQIEAIGVAALAWVAGRVRRLAADERGEGVISMGVAILITVVIGALMFAGLKVFWEDMYERIINQIPGISG